LICGKLLLPRLYFPLHSSDLAKSVAKHESAREVREKHRPPPLINIDMNGGKLIQNLKNSELQEL
jgi:hypothetical protein